MKSSSKIFLLLILSFLSDRNGNAQISGPGGTFNTFNEVMTYLQGVSTFSGDFVYEVTPGTYNEQIICPYLESNTSSKIIFKKETGANEDVNITYSPNSGDENYVIKVNGAHYQFEDIYFQNTSDESTGKGTVLTFNNTSDDNDDLRFINCKFTGININNSSNFNNFNFSIIGFNEDYYINNTHFINDTIIGGSYGIYLSHAAIKSYDEEISGCIIKDFSASGIFINNLSQFLIDGNIITSNVSNTNEVLAGIQVSNSDNSFGINGNKIDLSAQAEKVCIKISDVTMYPLNITNNMLTTRENVNGTESSTGIELINSANIYINYNSIWIQDGNSNSSALNVTETNNNLINADNNIFLNSASGYAVSVNEQNQFSEINFNDYYSTSGTPFFISSIGSSSDLYNWQFIDPLYPVDLNSFFALPSFKAVDDLHIDTQHYTYIEGRGTSLTKNINVDFDGEPRDLAFPDIGADEGKFTLIWVGDIMNNVMWHGSFFVKDTINVVFISQSKSGNLTIIPNTKIRFLSGAKLNVNANVNAVGLKDSMIVFTAADTLQPWAGITHGDSDTSYYEYCKFEYASADSGGVFNISNNDQITISHSKFFKNHATNVGGAVYTEYCSPIIDANLFYQNSATEGGAIFNVGKEAVITNNIFYDNSTTGDGGAVAIYNTSPASDSFYNNTFYKNFAGGSSGHDVYLNNTTGNIINCIFWNDIPNIRVFEINGNPHISNCIIKGTFQGNFSGPLNIYTEDPKLKDPDNFDFTILPVSIAVNNGSNITGQELTSDYYGRNRIYDYQNSGIVDIGAYELQALKLEADAGPDISDCNSTQFIYIFQDPYPYFGNLTTDNPEINIYNIGGTKTYYNVTNIPPGTTPFYWTVTDGIVSDTDTLLVTNTQPYVNAGDDIFMINPDINNNIYPDTIFNANQPLTGQTGYWTQLSGNSVSFSDVSTYNPAISNITYGSHLFSWTINDNGCINSDSLMLVAGHSFVSIPNDGTLDWDNPADWDVNSVPGPADSVTVYNCTGNVNISGAKCDRLIVGNGGTLNFEGTTKAPADFTCRTIFIEQNAEKFKGAKGTANILIGNDATVNIGSEYLSKSMSPTGSGLFINGGGSVFVKTNSAKSAKGGARLNIGNGGVIFIEQNAEKGVGNAEFHIGEGGFVFMEQNAEKKKLLAKNGANADFYVGNGGFVFMEQNAEKGSGGFLHLSAGRTIFIEQNAEKNTATGGHFGLFGGTVFIEQNAEKKSKSYQNPGLYLGQGGTIFIEQNAEKALSNPEFIAPEVVINGGQIKIGNSAKTKSAAGIFQFRQIFIEQNAEKGTLDTALIVYPSGALILSDTASVTPDLPSVNIGSGNAVSFLNGSNIQFENNWFESSEINISEGASLVDYNPGDNLFGKSSHIFKANTNEFYSPFIKDLWVSDFGNIEILNWDESQFGWNPMPNNDILSSGSAYYFHPSITDTLINLWGDINQGDISVPVTNDNSGIFNMQGWNLLGNPYPSYIDLEATSLPSEINNTFYFIKTNNQVPGIYQQGGISLNGADAYAAPSEAFMIKTEANSTFTFNNNARVHLPQSSGAKTASDYLKLKIQNNNFSDEIALSFNVNASDDFDSQYDAVKFITTSYMNPLFYSPLADGTKLAINTVSDFTDQKIIPVNFTAAQQGSYSLNLSGSYFTDDISIILKDLKDNTTQDLNTNPVYNFNFDLDDPENRFEIILTKASKINDIISEKVKIFTDGNTVFINSGNKNSFAEIYNLNGQILKQINLIKGLNSFSLNVSSGIYFIKVTSKQNSVNKKIFIRK